MGTKIEISAQSKLKLPNPDYNCRFKLIQESEK
jgi:hypothetical protein